MKEFLSALNSWRTIAGLILSALFAMVMDMQVCIVPAVVVAFGIEFFAGMRENKWNWYGFTATILGGAIIQLFVLL